jgi:hypothetical protein
METEKGLSEFMPVVGAVPSGSVLKSREPFEPVICAALLTPLSHVKPSMLRPEKSNLDMVDPLIKLAVLAISLRSSKEGPEESGLIHDFKFSEVA